MNSRICFIFLMQQSIHDIVFGEPNGTLNFGPVLDIECEASQVLNCNWLHSGKSVQVGRKQYRYSCTTGNGTKYCAIYPSILFQLENVGATSCWCQSTESPEIVYQRNLSENVKTSSILLMKISPNDTTIFPFQNVSLMCVFSEKVNCVWKHNGAPVTIGENFLQYQHGGNGKNTKDCSIEIVLPSELEAGIWSCENALEQTNAKSVVETVKLSFQECGRANELDIVDGKISGGRSPTRNKYPWIVGIHNRTKSWEYPLYVSLFCHGSLISKNWIMTAGHCAYTNLTLGILRPINQIFISLGSHFMDESVLTTMLVLREVCNVFVHPLYDIEYDVALMNLAKPVTFSASISPICLPPPYINITGQMVTVAGWGETKDSIHSLVLQEITIQVIPNLDCRLLLNRKWLYITPRMLCAGQLSGQKDTCKGDSGSALVLKLVDRYVVVGIASFGVYSCNQPYAPKIFGRVSEFLPFINAHLQEESC